MKLVTTTLLTVLLRFALAWEGSCGPSTDPKKPGLCVPKRNRLIYISPQDCLPGHRCPEAGHACTSNYGKFGAAKCD
ncbi:hypothetical protein EJ03DRAFT_325094 [Teratosphaeria nubilosa]|uniref:Secreted protein n=1 Tax=Teratosphaeria nubilosa TaxID=161662 RepID=A0A6G1LGY3_9PEZI|nr:hypothetical protein EJ03DRAFT_325094 [Teratosphaeria nubilosa]